MIQNTKSKILTDADYDIQSISSESDSLDWSILNDSKISAETASSSLPPSGIDLQDLAMRVKSRKGSIYHELRISGENFPPEPSATFASNQCKNRYRDIPCLDHSRVRLNDETSDYIHANFMDGYKRTNAYISAQGPLPETFGDFWQMIWEQEVVVIVMITRFEERGKEKCRQYWPLEPGQSIGFGCFSAQNVHVEPFEAFQISHLELLNIETEESRKVFHFFYKSWPDYDVPKSASSLLDFCAQVNKKQESLLEMLSEGTQPPMVVHCSAGIGRTGTFCTMDICISRSVVLWILKRQCDT
ncbi:hypothetical protein DNTS_004086 [Danionella cerebrum]|uniref:protein-tyrosine-phosphatase n=1 Tax=Danionella cerebrum TaxID=2873325 RepID=A0A553MUF5_9TELE|nr:hypothetical protein DNTS_004086 [Danionella translucida]